MSSDDSFDDDEEFKPRSSNSRKSKAASSASTATAPNNRKRRIVMRIEFDDDDEDSDDLSSTADDSSATDDANDDRPSCSNTIRRSRRVGGNNDKNLNPIEVNSDDQQSGSSVGLNRRQRNLQRRPYALNVNSDAATSDSEIEPRTRTRKTGKNFIVSDDEREREREREERPSNASAGGDNTITNEDNGFSSDSSSNELLEKCPICLLTFRQQEIGTPATCEHVFCAACIEAWSKNVQTCPIDRLEFNRIIVRVSYQNREVLREINVDPNRISKELQLDDEEDEEELTNCEICQSPEREDVMLLCDACNQGYHIYCLNPPLETIPEGSWYCDNCFDSSNESENDDINAELNILYDDIRDMGIPESHLRVTEVYQPQILRTRQNERIRAAVLRRTRASLARGTTSELTTTTTTSSLRSGSRRTTTTTTTTTRTRSAGGASSAARATTTRSRRTAAVKTRRRRRRRRGARQRTYVVEYDLNNFDEKFAIKTTKKVVRRRRRKRKARTTKRTSRASRRSAVDENTSGARMTASRRLAEQLGVKRDPAYHSNLAGSGGNSFSLFGNANALEYFSDSDGGGDAADGGLDSSEIVIETGHGTAVQTSVRISNVRTAAQSRKSLLLGRLKGDTTTTRGSSNVVHNAGTPDLLSSILHIQDRWHNATRNMESVRINTDGTLNFAAAPQPIVRPTATTTESTSAVPSDVVTQAPMYPRGGGGGNAGFNSGGAGGNSGGGGSGGYNNRYGGGSSNYRGGGGGGSANTGSTYGRHSSGGALNLSSLQGRGNFSFSDPNYDPNANQNQSFPSFNLRFNPRNQQQNNQNNNNNSSNMNQQSQRQQLPLQRNSLPFTNSNGLRQAQSSNMPPQQQSQHTAVPANMLFGGLPPPQLNAPPPGFPMMSHQPPPQQAQPPPPQLFAGLPPPIQAPVVSIPPPTSGMPMMSVPPPPAPPAMVQAMSAAASTVAAPWNNSLFKLNADYGNDEDDDSNCPNFSVYSQESQAVAMASDVSAAIHASGPLAGTQGDEPKEDDENEDLVQLDDDDDIPLPPEGSTSSNANTAAPSAVDLYEPDNPTEENDDEDDEGDDNDDDDDDDGDDYDCAAKPKKAPNNFEKEQQVDDDNEKTMASESDKDAAADDTELEDEDSNRPHETETTSSIADKYDPEHETDSKSDTLEENKNSTKTTKKSKSRSSSPAMSEIKLPVDSEVGSVGNRKNVLELYDDSDWEELDIDKPKKAAGQGQGKGQGQGNSRPPSDRGDGLDNADLDGDETPTEEAAAEKAAAAAAEAASAVAQIEPDRSYTPCLDENIEPGEIGAATERDSATPTLDDAVDDDGGGQQKKGKDTSSSSLKPDSIIADMDTELISDDEEEDQQPARGSSQSPGRNRKRSDNKRSKDNVEQFKKVSNKTKGRNYRVDKPESSGNKRSFKRRSSRSRSRSSSRSKSKSRSPPPYRNKFRSRTPRRSRSRSLLKQRGGRGGRRNSRSRSRTRSRSRSNNKENRMGRSGRRENKFNKRQSNNRPKRREMPRYDVRNVIGTTKRPAVDRYGRDAARQLRSRSRSISPLRKKKSRSGSRTPHTSRSRSRSLSVNRNRNRGGGVGGRFSFSLSPTPPPAIAAGRSPLSPIGRRFNSPRRRASVSPRRRTPPRRPISRSPQRQRSRSMSPVHRMNGRRVVRRIKNRSRSRSRSTSFLNGPSKPAGRYTPNHSPSRSPRKGDKPAKKKKSLKKKKVSRKRASFSVSPSRRISRQRSPFVDDFLAQPHKKRRQSPVGVSKSPLMDEPHWSPSPSPPPPNTMPVMRYDNDINASWTPPIQSPTLHANAAPLSGLYGPDIRRSLSKSSKTKTDKHKRPKAKKKKIEKSKRETRKEKRRKRRTETPEPAPSKEVFASGNNILVSVSFNKEVGQGQPQQQTTVVTLPPNREDLLVRRNSSVDRLGANASTTTKKTRKEKTHRRKKLVDAKPVAIIDLDRSPFQVHQEPADVIVLTDSEESNESIREGHRRGHQRKRSMSGNEDMREHHRGNAGNGSQAKSLTHHDNTPPMLDRMDTIHEESYEIQQTGPKTPPEPPLIKFNLNTKKQTKVRNPLHDDADDMDSDNELPGLGGSGGGGGGGSSNAGLGAGSIGGAVGQSQKEQLESQQQQHNHQSQRQQQQQDTLLDSLHTQSSQKIGPNTPPESGPCSPDVYDPFEPTKSPSLSPRSPSPPKQAPTLVDTSIIDSDMMPTQKFIPDERDREGSSQRHEIDNVTTATTATSSGPNGNGNAQSVALNPVELVMSLMNNKSGGNSQDLLGGTGKSNESQYSGSASGVASGALDTENANSVGAKANSNDNDNHSITVLSNVLISNSQNTHIPVISSPTPPSLLKQKTKASGSTAGSSILPNTNGRGTGGSGNAGTADDTFNMLDFDSPYSPGSADYEDLFEPPPDTSGVHKRRSKRNQSAASGAAAATSANNPTAEVFDNLFGSTSPIGNLRLPSYTPSTKKHKSSGAYGKRKPSTKGKANEEHAKAFDDPPNSAVDFQAKDKFLRKLNRQERVVEEVKLLLKPRFNKKQITKDDYKEIMRRAVPKICHSRSGEINPNKIKNLIEAYVKKFRAKHKKLNLINTGQVSSAVKCAAYLKKL